MSLTFLLELSQGICACPGANAAASVLKSLVQVVAVLLSFLMVYLTLTAVFPGCIFFFLGVLSSNWIENTVVF